MCTNKEGSQTYVTEAAFEEVGIRKECEYWCGEPEKNHTSEHNENM